MVNLPKGVNAIHVLTDDDGWSVYHLQDARHYTIRQDTIRVGRYNNTGEYRVETWRSTGWTHVLAGRTNGREDSIEWVTEGVENAVRVLYHDPERFRV